MLDQDFLKFIIKRTIEVGEVYRIEEINDVLHDRVEVDATTIPFTQVSLDKFHKYSGNDDKFLCALKLTCSQGYTYGAHAVIDWDEALTSHWRTYSFTLEELFQPRH